jgi:hypothetical protein
MGESSKKNIKFIEDFFVNKNLKFLINISKENKSTPKYTTKKPHLPNLRDLYNLYNYVLLNKRTTILEFGSGWSTLIFSLALKEIRDKYLTEAKLLRRGNLYELFVVENEKKYLNLTKKNIRKYNKILNIKNPIKINFLFSDVQMSIYNNKICTEYKKLPLCNPDFIYLDGPGQFSVKKDIKGISTRHKDMMPMASDILKLEYFLMPGSMIVCDGRAANVKFIKDHFKRKWKYIYNKKNDQHIFRLDDPVLGKYNKLLLDYYKKRELK